MPDPTTAQPPSIDERITAMRVRVKAQEARDRLAREKAERIAQEARDLACNLSDSLASLRGLPVRRPDDAIARGCTVTVDFSWPPHVLVGCHGHTFQQFTITADLDAAEPVVRIEHDGDTIILDVAVDLAVAAVEAALAVDDKPVVIKPDLEMEIPF